MPEQETSLDQLSKIRDIASQAFGFTPVDEVVQVILKDKSISIDQLSKHHTLTEIGTALIRLDALSKVMPDNQESSELQFCVKFGDWTWCPNIQKPPLEG